jgi:hypothetical protein
MAPSSERESLPCKSGKHHALCVRLAPPKEGPSKGDLLRKTFSGRPSKEGLGVGLFLAGWLHPTWGGTTVSPPPEPPAVSLGVLHLPNPNLTASSVGGGEVVPVRLRPGSPASNCFRRTSDAGHASEVRLKQLWLVTVFLFP